MFRVFCIIVIVTGMVEASKISRDEEDLWNAQLNRIVAGVSRFMAHVANNTDDLREMRLARGQFRRLLFKLDLLRRAGARYHTIDDVLRQAGEEEEEKKEERGFYWEGVKVYPYSRRELLAEPWDKYTWHPASPRPDILTTTPTAPSETTSTSAPEATSPTPTPETTSSPLCQLPTEPISDELFRYLRELEDRVEEKDYLLNKCLERSIQFFLTSTPTGLSPPSSSSVAPPISDQTTEGAGSTTSPPLISRQDGKGELASMVANFKKHLKKH